MFKVHCVLQVICCEGNAGFYEVGCMNTPLDGKHFCGQVWNKKEKLFWKQVDDLPSCLSPSHFQVATLS